MAVMSTVKCTNHHEKKCNDAAKMFKRYLGEIIYGVLP